MLFRTRALVASAVLCWTGPTWADDPAKVPAKTLTIVVDGTLGPVLSGNDPAGLDGQSATMTVTAAPLAIQAGLAKNSACCGPAGGPGGKGSAGATGTGAGACIAAPPELVPPDMPAPPLWPETIGTGCAAGCVSSCAAEGVRPEASKATAVASDSNDLVITGLAREVSSPSASAMLVKRRKGHKAARRGRPEGHG